MGRDSRGVKKASQTSIEITFIYEGRRCRERIKGKPTDTNIRKIERLREQILESIADGSFNYAESFPDSKRVALFNPKAALTVEKWMDEWMKSKQPILKKSTYAGYRQIIYNQIIPALGHIKLSELRRRDVRDWVAPMVCCNRTISNLLTPLRAALQEAMRDDVIESNPLYNWNYKKNEPPKESDVRPFTSEEQVTILGALKGQEKNMIQFAFWTGLRTSELIAIEWGDIDWNKSVAKIQRARTRASAKPESTKSNAGNREVKLLEPALHALKNQKEHTYLLGKEIFMRPATKKPWTGDIEVRRRCWVPALKKAGVDYRRQYQTRHTYASMMLSAGEPLAWLSRQMGHSSVTITMQVYARWLPDENIDAGNRAVELFNKGEL